MLEDRKEVVHASGLHRTGGQEPIKLDVLGFQRYASLPGQDKNLATDVLTGKVDSGIRLGESFLFRLRYDLMEGPRTVEVVEDETERTAKHTFDLTNTVTAVHQIMQRRDDR